MKVVSFVAPFTYRIWNGEVGGGPERSPLLKLAVNCAMSLAVKGVDTPVQSYFVTRAKPRAFRILTRGIEGIATRMIGRDAELALLQGAFLQLFQPAGASPGPRVGLGPELKVITVVAEAGLGKSRLLYEFESWAETRPERFLVFRGRARRSCEHQRWATAPIGVYDPSAPPKKLQPTPRGYGLAAALEKCRELAEVHAERAQTGGLREAKAERRKTFIAQKAAERRSRSARCKSFSMPTWCT